MDRNSRRRTRSCRNSRVRAMYEQIWPTKKLTDEETALFRRNSKLFVVEMGRSVTLNTKLRATPGDTKVPLHEMRTKLYEKDLHVDAVGENPRFLRLRRVKSMYGYKLMNYRKVKLLMGGVDRKLMLRLFHEARLTPGSHKAWKYISAMESRLDQVLTKMGAAEDILDAGHVLKRDLVYLNGSLPTRRNDYFVQPGDVLSPNAADPQELKNHVARAMRPLLERVYNSF